MSQVARKVSGYIGIILIMTVAYAHSAVVMAVVTLGKRVVNRNC